MYMYIKTSFCTHKHVQFLLVNYVSIKLDIFLIKKKKAGHIQIERLGFFIPRVSSLVETKTHTNRSATLALSVHTDSLGTIYVCVCLQCSVVKICIF